MVYPVRFFLTPSLIIMQNLVAVSRTVHVGGPKNFGNVWAPHLSRMVGIADPKNMLFPMRYQTRFSCSRLNHVGIKFWGL